MLKTHIFLFKIKFQTVLNLFILLSWVPKGSGIPQYDYSGEIPGGELQNAFLDEQGCGEGEAFFPDYEQCGLYHKCRKDETINDDWIRDDYYCPEGQSFDEELLLCVDIPCSQRPPYRQVPPEWPACPRVGRKIQVPDKCRHYYTCWWTGSYYTYSLGDCGLGYFRETLQDCLPHKTCPSTWPERPPDWDCGYRVDSGQKLPHPDHCDMYYKCHSCKEPDDPNDSRVCVEFFTCKKGQYFDIKKKGCKAGKCNRPPPPPPRPPPPPPPPPPLPPPPPPPPMQTKLPTGWECAGDNSLHVMPTDCTKYYRCFICDNIDPNAPVEFCYDGIKSCPAGMFFDDIVDKCVVSSVCPQDLLPLPPGWECKGEDELSVNPDHCNMFYRCIPCNQAGGKCMDPMTCPAGQNFDDNIDQCVDGVCPGDLIPIEPEVHECAVPGEKNPDPMDCAKYYECHKCSHGPGGWCYLPFDCPPGHNFDEIKEKCVATPCPQLLVPKPNKGGYNCQSNGQTNVHPQDCTRWYACYECSKSDNGWCIQYNDCPAGQFFNDETDTCGRFDGCCPQTGCPPPPPPPPPIRPPPPPPPPIRPPPPPPPPEPSSSSSSSEEGEKPTCKPKYNKRRWKTSSCGEYLECECYSNGQCKMFRYHCVYPTWFWEPLQCCVIGTRYSYYCKNSGRGCWYGVNNVWGRQKR